jgi:glycosyltransferase involved in cell wall biosynthesis
MRVIFDYQIFLKQKYGGPSRYFFELNKHLQKINVNSEIFSPLHINNYLSNKKYCFNIKKKFYFNKILSKINEGLTYFYLKSKKELIIHPTYYNFDYLFSNKNKKVITVFDLIHEKFYSPERIKRFKDEKIKALKEADFIICISENTKKDLIDYYNIEKKKTQVIYLSYLINPEKKFNVVYSNNKPFILYVGNRHGYKNFEIILKAFNASPEIKNNFLLYCFGGGEFSKNEIDLFKENNFTNEQYKYLGNNEEILGSLYSRAFCLIYPSLYEGFGLPVLEAMNNNCPVICSNTSSLPEVGGDTVEYFNPRELDSLVDAIKKIINSEKYRNILIKNAFIRSKIFSWEKTAQETFQVYKSLL